MNLVHLLPSKLGVLFLLCHSECADPSPSSKPLFFNPWHFVRVEGCSLRLVSLNVRHWILRVGLSVILPFLDCKYRLSIFFYPTQRQAALYSFLPQSAMDFYQGSKETITCFYFFSLCPGGFDLGVYLFFYSRSRKGTGGHCDFPTVAAYPLFQACIPTSCAQCDPWLWRGTNSSCICSLQKFNILSIT